MSQGFGVLCGSRVDAAERQFARTVDGWSRDLELDPRAGGDVANWRRQIALMHLKTRTGRMYEWLPGTGVVAGVAAGGLALKYAYLQGFRRAVNAR